MSTVIGGTLTAALFLSAGTYEVSATLQMGNFPVIFDSLAGDIIVKPWPSVSPVMSATGTGSISAINVNDAYRIVFTSRNDNTRGDVYALSTGTASATDNGYVWGSPALAHTSQCLL